MKKIWIPAALMALAACSMTNNAEKGQGDSQDITTRPAITQVAENVPSEPSVDSVEVDGISSATALPNHSSFNGIMVVPPQRQATVTLTMGGTVHATTLLPGDYVKKGSVIVSLENPDFITLQQTYLDAHAQTEYLEAEYKRQQRLSRARSGLAKTFPAKQGGLSFHEEPSRCRCRATRYPRCLRRRSSGRRYSTLFGGKSA